jgi:hypothetical protein
MERINNLDKDTKEPDFDATEALKWDLIPLLVDLARLWHESQRWNVSNFNNYTQAIAGISSKLIEIDASVTSISESVDEISSNPDDAVPYQTQFTEEDADSLIKFAMAAMHFISTSPGDEQTKQALLARGQEVVQTIQANTLEQEEDEDDDDTDR